MKFDPISKQVFTDKGEFIKSMSCPYRISWENLEETNSTSRNCAKCDHLILDTEFLSDDEILGLVKDDPATCLKIDLQQDNVKLTSDGILEQK